MLVGKIAKDGDREVTGLDILGRPTKAWTGCDVLMTYEKSDGTMCVNRRVDDVLFKLTSAGHWVMVGADVGSKEPRSFRVERIRSLVVLRGPDPTRVERDGNIETKTRAA